MSGWTDSVASTAYVYRKSNQPHTPTHRHTRTRAACHTHTQCSFQFGFPFFFILYFGRFWLCGFLWKNVARLKIKHWHLSTFNVDKIYRFVRGFIDKIFKPRMKLKFTKIKQREARKETEKTVNSFPATNVKCAQRYCEELRRIPT